MAEGREAGREIAGCSYCRGGTVGALRSVEALVRISSHGALTENESHMVGLARDALAAVPEELKRAVVDRIAAQEGPERG